MDEKSLWNKYKKSNSICYGMLECLAMIKFGFKESEIIEKFGFPIISHQTFCRYRKILLPTEVRRKVKNPNNKIRMRDFQTIKELTKKYRYFISYDGIENKLEGFYNSAIRFFFNRINQNGKIETLEKYVAFHDKGSHSENLQTIEKLWNRLFRDTKYKEIINDFNFFIYADKHRAITSFINNNCLNGFISSNPTSIFKQENLNREIKTKAFLCQTFECFKDVHGKTFNSILVKTRKNAKKQEQEQEIESESEFSELYERGILVKA